LCGRAWGQRAIRAQAFVNLVLALVDSHHGTILAETWQQVTVGAERPQGFPGPVLDVEWNGHSRSCPKKIAREIFQHFIFLNRKFF
jgi:hypothetical protein